MDNQELILPSFTSLAASDGKDTLVIAMEEIGIDEVYIAKELKNIIDNAITADSKGNLLEDFPTKLSAIKTWRKFQKDSPDVSIQIANIFPTGTNIL